MPLFEASWDHSPSVLLSAPSAGAAIFEIQSKRGAETLYQMRELNEIQPDNFLLVRRCGMVYEKQPIPHKFCPGSSMRVFRVSRYHDKEEAVILVDHITELPALVLWHFDHISQEECLHDELVSELWQRHNSSFSLLEVDTESTGILLCYDYCRCAQTSTSKRSPLEVWKKDLD